jgi:hypothetical protein
MGEGAIPNNQPADLKSKVNATIESVIDKILVVRVTTVVGTITVTNAEKSDTLTEIVFEPDDQLVAHTAVNTALGDINVLISKAFLADETMMKLHNDSVERSKTVRKEAVEALQSAITAIAGILKL